MKGSRVEAFARTQPEARTASVRQAASRKVEQRREALTIGVGGHAEDARQWAAETKAWVLDHLQELLVRFEARCIENGVKVHWAVNAESARNAILDILASRCEKGDVVAKGKSMVTEEIHLNAALEEAGYRPVETDLGEFVVQVDHDTPSHIVMPIIHKSRFEVARSFHRDGLGPYTEDPAELTLQAREHLRGQFRKAAAGISGVNFAVAESGRLVIIENEGNNRLSTTAPRTHIAVMGIEKLLPSEIDLPIFLELLASSSTGQKVATYMHLISGPRRADEEDGPEEVHLVLVDNGRSKVLSGPYRDILRCIRCGACQNVCPVFRVTSGHGYGHVYGGPIGAVLAPAKDGVEAYGDLAKASSLCGACEEVCPVKIPIPHLLLQLRHEAVEKSVVHDGIPWHWFGKAAASAKVWKTGLSLLPYASSLPNPALGPWTEFKEAPAKQGRDFRRWWRERT